MASGQLGLATAHDLAALAERHRLTVLHYDHDFDRLRQCTGLRFSSDWLGPSGSL